MRNLIWEKFVFKVWNNEIQGVEKTQTLRKQIRMNGFCFHHVNFFRRTWVWNYQFKTHNNHEPVCNLQVSNLEYKENITISVSLGKTYYYLSKLNNKKLLHFMTECSQIFKTNKDFLKDIILRKKWLM